MRVGGWRTRSVFQRYDIVSQADIADALQKLELSQNEIKPSFGHDFGHDRQETNTEGKIEVVN